jgi:hypothetical protein
MVKLGTIRFKGKCDKHPRFDPMDGEGAIRGGCRRCMLLLDIFQAHGRLIELIRKAKNEAGAPAVRKAAAAAADTRQASLF